MNVPVLSEENVVASPLYSSDLQREVDRATRSTRSFRPSEDKNSCLSSRKTEVTDLMREGEANLRSKDAIYDLAVK